MKRIVAVTILSALVGHLGACGVHDSPNQDAFSEQMTKNVGEENNGKGLLAGISSDGGQAKNNLELTLKNNGTNGVSLALLQEPSFSAAGTASANKALLSYYSSKTNYDKVYKEVLSYYPAGRSNGCVAFVTSALRQSGTFVPKDLKIEGYNVSLVTIAMAKYLQQKLGWKKITSSAQLQPGDVVLTEAEKTWPGVPAHTYVFHSWKNQATGIGYVIDNQDFIHERNIFGFGTHNFTPFEYALRAPK